MRPIDVCTSKPFPTRALVRRRFPAQRPSPREALRRRPEVALIPEPRGSVLVRANCLHFAPTAARPKTRGVCTGKLGAARCERGRGEPRFHDAILTSAPGRRSARGVIFPGESTNPTASDVPVASSFPLAWARVSSSTTRWSRGRQDRFCVGPRERAALFRSGTPSTGSCSRTARSGRSTNEPA